MFSIIDFLLINSNIVNSLIEKVIRFGNSFFLYVLKLAINQTLAFFYGLVQEPKNRNSIKLALSLKGEGLFWKGCYYAMALESLDSENEFDL